MDWRPWVIGGGWAKRVGFEAITTLVSNYM